MRHSVLALSALHRDYVVEGVTKLATVQINSNALQQYNKAIHHVQNYLSRELLDERTVLICCKLFYCIEVVRGDYRTAMRHVKSGLIILRDWKAKQKYRPASNMNSKPVDDIDNLIGIFNRLDVQFRIFEQGQPPYLGLVTPEERSGLVSCVPKSFRSLADVWVVTNKLSNWGFHFLASCIERKRGLPENTYIGNKSELPVLEKEFDRWSTTFEAFMQDSASEFSNLDLESATTASVIHGTTKALVLLFAERKAPLELQEDFKDILNMAETIIIRRNMDSNALPRGFTFETGLVASLLLIAMTCGSQVMCERAVGMMKLWPRREGLWDGNRVPSALEKAQRLIQNRHSRSQGPEQRHNGSADGAGEAELDTLSFWQVFWYSRVKREVWILDSCIETKECDR